MMNSSIFLLYLLSAAVIPAMPEIPDNPDLNLEEQPSSKSKAFFVSLIRQRQKSTSQISSRLLIVGGTEATPNQFPYQVTVHVRNYMGGYNHNCGGVIYDSIHILTAAHCLRGYHAKNLKIIAGEHEFLNDEGPEQYRDVSSYIFHPEFNPLIFDNDIGIITLDWPLDLNDKVKPLRLPSESMVHSKTARNLGWGTDGVVAGGPQPKLRYVDLFVFSRQQCVQAYDFEGMITEGMMCAGDEEGGKGSCNGDSGGPLICKDTNDLEYLCGLVSWGMIPCALPQYPTVFANINYYLDWLHALLPPQELK